jgi:hypothetical protein
VYVSGDVANSEASCLLKYVRGEGMVRFEWRVSVEEEYDELAVFVDNVALATLSGEKKAWEPQSFEVKNQGGEGGGEEHTITFCFFKDRSLSEGADGAEVQNFVFTPALAGARQANDGAHGIGGEEGEKREVKQEEEKKITSKPTHLRRRQYGEEYPKRERGSENKERGGVYEAQGAFLKCESGERKGKCV